MICSSVPHTGCPLLHCMIWLLPAIRLYVPLLPLFWLKTRVDWISSVYLCSRSRAMSGQYIIESLNLLMQHNHTHKQHQSHPFKASSPMLINGNAAPFLLTPQDAFPRWCWVWNLAGQFLLWCAIHGSVWCVAPLAGGCDLSCSLWLHRECMLWMCWHLVAAGCSGIWPSKAVWRWQRPGRCAADSLALQAWFTRRWWARYSFLWRGGCHLPAACSTRRM